MDDEPVPAKSATGKRDAGHSNVPEYVPPGVEGYNPETGMVERKVGKLTSAVQGAVDMGTFGFGDEIRAGIGSVATGVPYDRALAQTRRMQSDAQEQNPMSYLGGQLAGGLATGIVAAPAAAPSLGGRILQGASLGAGYGGTYGFGSGEGGVENRATNAMVGGVTGAVLGMAIPAATTAIRKGYNALTAVTTQPAANAIRSTVNPKNNALQLTQRQLARDGLTPDDAAAKMQAAIDAGDDSMMLMDVAGDNTRRLGRFASNIPGKGADKLKETVYDRQLAQPERITAAIRKGLDDPENYYTTIDDIIAQRQAASKPLYEQARATPVPFTQKLESLLGRGKVMRDALRKARDMGEAEGIPSQQFFVNIADDGSYTIKSVPDARQWDLIKRSLDDIIEAEKTMQPNGAEKMSNLGRVVSGIKREMLEEIDRHNPAYAAARKVYSSASESLDAVTRGGKLLDADPELARRMLQKMSEGDKQLARLGVSKALVARVQKREDGMNAVRGIFTSPKHRAVLKEIFPDEKSFDDFKMAMEGEAQKTRTKNAIQGNSTTAQQLTDIADNQVDMGVAGNLLTGRLGAAAGSVVQKALSRATVVNEATARELADILTTTDPQVAKAILGEMQRMAMKDARVAKNLVNIRSMLRNTAIIGGTKGATDVIPLGKTGPMEITVGARDAAR
jgi:hypothetical protein